MEHDYRRHRMLMVLLLLAFSLGQQSGRADRDQPEYPPTIVFMTDFGTLDDAVAICKGVMYSIVSRVRIVDLTHQVRPFSILDGARFLFGATPYYPAGTIFVAVIDPTVGSSRRAIVAKSRRGQFFVLPDNGLMSLVEERDGIQEVRIITNPAWMIGSKLSSTFHGRDIFSPVGAHLARGDDWREVGPKVSVREVVHLDWKPARVEQRGLSGEVIATDGPYGNLVTNIEAQDFLKLGYQPGERVPITIGNQQMTIPFVKTFADVPLKQALLYIDSRGRFGLAVNQDSFAAVYGISPPAEIFIPRKSR